MNFTKFNENSMEAKSQQNFYNKSAIVVISSKLSLWSKHFHRPGSGAKSHEMAHNNPILPVYVVYSQQRGTFSSLNLLGTCVQDMKSCPTPWKISDVLLIFVFLNDASKGRSYNVISEHHVLAIGWPNIRFQDLVLVPMRVQSPSYHLQLYYVVIR